MCGLKLDDHARGSIAPALPGCQVRTCDHLHLPVTCVEYLVTEHACLDSCVIVYACCAGVPEEEEDNYCMLPAGRQV